jgi:hypothetical protein
MQGSPLPRLLPILLSFVSAHLLCGCQAVRESSLAAIAGPAVAITKPFFQDPKRPSGEPATERHPFKGTARLDHLSGSLFFFDHDPAAPFSCTVTRLRDGRPTVWTIHPEPFLTDGASVPRALWCLSGFGPFDFTKSALIHDWLFEAHHRWCAAFHEGDLAGMLRYRDYADPTLIDRLSEPLRARMWPLSIVEASDIMATCIRAESQLNGDVIVETSAIITDETLPQGLRSKLDGIVRGTVAPARAASGTARQYHWATRSREALRIWNADASGRPEHVSSAQLIGQLDAGPAPTLLDEAIAEGSLSPSLVERLRRSAREG